MWQSGITVREEDPFWLLALYSITLGSYPPEQDWQNAAWDLAVKKDSAECKPLLGNLLATPFGNSNISDTDRHIAAATSAFCVKVD